MPIHPGRRLGPYEISSAIGTGGMGEVYKGRDTRRDRIVAIKVLLTHLADRLELRERFEREARTITSLNHPHICTLYDVGHQDDLDYLVMVYLEGEPLGHRLLKGPLPLEQVLQFAIEISDALDKAHRKGVTHRDLKPGNIMLTKSGSKLLDFGLAELKQEATPANGSLSNLPTASDPLTAQGSIIGTLQYMAPEQVEGKSDQIDARTDIFAFGEVVYEMATGKRAFEGKSQASLIAAILELEPPAMSSLQPMTPPALDHLVKRCLAKDPDERWQSPRDICEQLRWISDSGREAGAPAVAAILVAQQKRVKKRFLWAGVVIGVIALTRLAFFLYPYFQKASPATPGKPVTRFVITLPPGQHMSLGDLAIALSPDGNRLAYVASQAGTSQLYVRAMSDLEAKPIPDSDGASAPFFSPDNQWLGFFAGSKLKKVPINSGAAVVLFEVPGALPRGGS
jgi:tRNA A-37 threonylcarbamoyl transferase component Bud32